MKVTKWSTISGDLNVSEQKAELISGEPGSLSAEPAASPSSDAQNQRVGAAAQEPVQAAAHIASPDLVPEQGAAEPPEANAVKAEPAKAETPKADAARAPGKVMIMSAGDRNWAKDNGANPKAESEPSPGMFGKRRLAALAAVVVLAAVAGALATAGLSHLGSDDTTSAANRALEASIARIDADIMNLKASVEHTSKMGMSQFNKTSDRLDKVEKAQLEPAAKLAKLSEAVEKLRSAQPAAVPVAAAAPAPVAAKEVTGSIAPPAIAPADAAKPEVGRLPTLEGWVLRGVANGMALIENRRGIYEVYAGDPVPGAGRVDAIRRQEGRWVVVTSKGLIVGR
jgi:hypothetical protein